MRLSEMMRLYIASVRIEQTEVAKECGVSETTISRFLDGSRLPRADAFARIVAWCCEGVPGEKQPIDYDSRLDALEKITNDLNRRTFGFVRLGGR